MISIETGIRVFDAKLTGLWDWNMWERFPRWLENGSIFLNSFFKGENSNCSIWRSLLGDPRFTDFPWKENHCHPQINCQSRPFAINYLKVKEENPHKNLFIAQPNPSKLKIYWSPFFQSVMVNIFLIFNSSWFTCVLWVAR